MFELEKILLKADNKFFEKLQTKDFYITDSGDTKIVLENAKNKCLMFLTVDDNGLYLNFKNSNNEFFNQGWCLGNINDLFILEDIFEILAEKTYLDFANVRIHKGSDNWRVEKLNKLKTNLKSILLSYDKDFFDVMNSLNFEFLDENLDRLIFMHKKSRTELVIRQYDRCIFYNFIRNEKYMFFNDGFGKLFGSIDKIEIEELYSLIKTRDFEIFLNKDIENYTDTQKKIKEICDEIAKLLIDKNKKYGNSALEPKNIFYKGNTENSILIRLDDKIGRITNNNGEIRTNDIVDIIGYLVLLLIYKNVMIETIAELRD